MYPKYDLDGWGTRKVTAAIRSYHIYLQSLAFWSFSLLACLLARLLTYLINWLIETEIMSKSDTPSMSSFGASIAKPSAKRQGSLKVESKVHNDCYVKESRSQGERLTVPNVNEHFRIVSNRHHK